MTILTNPETEQVRELLDWQALPAQVHAVLEDGRTITDIEHKAVVHSDGTHILGVHKKGYAIHQFSDWLVDNVEGMLDTPDLTISRAGLLKQSRVAFVQVSTKQTLSVQGVEFAPFINAATSHDGSIASSYFTGSTSIICLNTLAMALRTADARIAVRHTANSAFRIAEVRQALNIMESVASTFEVEVAALLDQAVSQARWEEFVKAYTGVEKAKPGRSLTMAQTKAGALRSLWRSDERVAPWAGTAYGVLAATNTYSHHLQSVKGDRAERNALMDVTGRRFAEDAKALALLGRVEAHA